MLLISGEFDISIGSQLSVIGVVMAMIIEQKSNIPFSIVAALLIGLQQVTDLKQPFYQGKFVYDVDRCLKKVIEQPVSFCA